jgi:hypothetical protein
MHSGLMRDDIAMSVITGKTRHLFGPDAVGLGGNLEAATAAAGSSLGVDAILIKRGPHKGEIIAIGSAALAAGFDVSASVVVTKYYFSGSLKFLKPSSFEGSFLSISAAFTFGIDIGAKASWSYVETVKNNFAYMYSLSYSLGVGIPSPFGPWNASANVGYTRKLSK